MSTIAVRWLGAFGRSKDLAASLQWELGGNRGGREVAATWWDTRIPPDVYGGSPTLIMGVGLLLARGAIIQRHKGDIWSVLAKDGKHLLKTRQGVRSHTECICRPEYRGIVISRPWGQLRAGIRRDIRAAVAAYKLPVLQLVGEKLKNININS